jgi:TnpA family transposase
MNIIDNFDKEDLTLIVESLLDEQRHMQSTAISCQNAGYSYMIDMERMRRLREILNKIYHAASGEELKKCKPHYVKS